jgi:hypothetical protein
MLETALVFPSELESAPQLNFMSFETKLKGPESKSPAQWPGFSFFKSKILRPRFAFPLVALHLKIPNPPEYVQASVHVLQRQSAFQRL